ncbi:MAG: VOC family protein [Gemmatimonadetes bacterium]|jgi:lactoylglutathione lyase|nr:VOC family protein [Gemmatimonadota bacterium]
MELGAFSVSLTVKDLNVSRDFYEKLGFSVTGGDREHYVIMVNGTSVVGLFQGMFPKNILTFNPGLTQNKETLADFTDVREIRAKLVEAGVVMLSDTDPDGRGPAHLAFEDPDGNPVLIDQFVPRPGSAQE